MPKPKPPEPTALRQRESRRTMRGLLAAHPNRARVIEIEARQLQRIIQRWDDRRAADRALATLRAVLPNAISGRDRQQAIDMIDQLAKWLDEVRPPEWMRSAEDKWLVDAQHELDDELAKILSPAGYPRDREKAIKNVRERRRKIARRR